MNASSSHSVFSRVPLLVMGLVWLLAVCVCRADVPVISAGPQPVSVAPGQSAVLSVQAAGVPPLSYQWFRNGFPAAGATGASHTIHSVNDATTGIWSVKVTDGGGDAVFAFCRVANPGAVLQFGSGVMGKGSGTAAAAQVPVALSDGDVSHAITSTGGLLWTNRGTDYDLESALETPPPDSQPADLGPVVQVAAHGPRVAVLQADGTVRAWTRALLNWEPRPMGTWSHTPVPLPPDVSKGKWVFMDERCLWVVRWDGTVAVVELEADALASLPPGLSQVAAVVTSTQVTGVNPMTYGTNRHALALREDGTVAAWGVNESGQTEVPAGLTDVVEVAAGLGWSLARKRDGTLVQWGAEQTGPFIGLGSLQPPTLDPIPPPAGAFRRIRVSGSQMAFALRDDGQMMSWGPFASSLIVYNPPLLTPAPPAVDEVLDFGNRSHGGLTSYLTTALCAAAAPVVVHPPEGVNAAAGGSVFLSVEATGRPAPSYQWLKDGVEVNGATLPQLKLAPFQAADAGNYTVRATNVHGTVTSSAAVVVAAAGPVITAQPQNLALHPGQGGTLNVAATGSGALSYRWFKNGRLIPGAVSATLPIASGLPSEAGVYQAEITDAQGTRRSELARVGEGCSPVGWREGERASFLDSVRYSSADVLIGLSEGEGWLGIGANGNLTWFYEYLRGATNDIYGSFWSSAAPWPVSFPSPGFLAPPQTTLGAVSVAVRERIGVMVNRQGFVSAWKSETGMNSVVPTAIGYYGYSMTPSNSHSLFTVPAVAQHAIAVSISATEEALALRTDGRVIAWKTRWGTLSAVPVSAGGEVTAISSGKDHHLALKDDGTVIAWGDNAEGECVVPGGLVNVTGIAALENVSFAIHADGTVSAWGDNSMGQTNVPVGLSGVASVRGARGTVLATKGDGDLVVWGASAVSALPASLTNVRAAGVMPVDPPPPGVIALNLGGRSQVSYGIALMPVAGPEISVQPQVLRVFPGFSGSICNAYASSFPNGPYSGVWQKNGIDLPATAVSTASASLVLNNVTVADAGVYRFAASNGWQTGLSSEVTLEVVQPRLFSGWQTANFTAAEIAAGLAAPKADPGGTGITNLMRYALGLDARTPDFSRLPQPEYVPATSGVSISPGVVTIAQPPGIRLTMEVPQDTADMAFHLESSSDLQTWQRTGGQPEIGSLQNGRRQISLTGAVTNIFMLGGSQVPTGPQRFFRIVIEAVTPSLAPSF